jgi:hypothetical protein
MSDNQQEVKIPYLKPNAILDVKLGARFISEMQQVLFYLIDGRDEDLKEMQKKQKGEEFTPWESAVMTCSMFMQEVMKIAESSGNIEYKSIEEIIPNNPDQDSNQPQ